MKYEEYMSLASEIAQLEDLLADLPEDMVIERMGLESRLERFRAQIEGVRRPSAPTPTPDRHEKSSISLPRRRSGEGRFS